MVPTDTADFHQIFLHRKQIIRPSESQLYIKKPEKSIYTVDTKFSRYLPSLNVIKKLFLLRRVVILDK